LTAPDARAWIADHQPGYSFVAAYAGHSRAREEELFADLNNQQKAVGPGASDAALVAGVGDDEQFATAAALLARYLGFESRVVLGVRLGTSTDPAAPACTSVCTGADLAAWVEVRSPGGGWVTMDADPQAVQAPRPVTQGQEPPANPTRVQLPDPRVVAPPETAQDAAADRAAPDQPVVHKRPPWWSVLRVIGLSLAALLLSVTPVVAVPLVKGWRRRRRRRSPVPEVVVVGAWAELADQCLDLGVPLSGPTRRAAARASGRPGSVALAELVDEAVFASAPPGAAVAVDAWDLAELDLAEVRAGIAPYRRAFAALHPRSLLRALHPGPSVASPGATQPASPKELS
jgi:hypothetical protein